MTTLTESSSVGDFVVERPSRSRVFEKLGIDYCCDGKKPLAEACQKKALDPHTVLRILDVFDFESDPVNVNIAGMTLTELADHIEQTHHVWLRKEMPRISKLLEKVAEAHGLKYFWLNEMLRIYGDLQAEMNSHMIKEEQVLFPMIRQLEVVAAVPHIMIAGVEAPVHCMESEHESAGRAVESLRRLSSNFTPPHGACNTFRALLAALAEFETNLHLHVHKENNILFPRAVEFEKSKTGTQVA